MMGVMYVTQTKKFQCCQPCAKANTYSNISPSTSQESWCFCVTYPFCAKFKALKCVKGHGGMLKNSNGKQKWLQQIWKLISYTPLHPKRVRGNQMIQGGIKTTTQKAKWVHFSWTETRGYQKKQKRICVFLLMGTSLPKMVMRILAWVLGILKDKKRDLGLYPLTFYQSHKLLNIDLYHAKKAKF